MPYPITTYGCKVCNQTYKQYYEAEQCERLGAPAEHNDVQLGDELEFERVDNLGVMHAFTWDKGKVIDKKIILLDNEHQWFFRVKTYDASLIEYGVTRVATHDPAHKHLVSLPNMMFKSL